jgi:hypothetical protein
MGFGNVWPTAIAIAFVKEAGHLRCVKLAEAARENVARYPAGLVVPHEMAKCCLRCFGSPHYFRSHSSLRSHPQEVRPPVEHPWMLAW